MTRKYILIILIAAYAQTLTGCPTCIGRLELQSPAFFSDELYQLNPEDDVKTQPKSGMVEKEKKKEVAEDDEDD